MSVYKVGESEDYDRSTKAASQLLDRLTREPELKIVKDLFWRLLHSLPSAPIKVLASFSDDRYYPLVLCLDPREFGSYLSLNHGDVVAARSRERIAALLSVYEAARSRIDFLDTEFRAYIARFSIKDQIDLDNLPFPSDKIMRRFCAPALHYFEAKEILLGLPDTTDELVPDDLSIFDLSPPISRKRNELASRIKSRALNRFYLAFLNSFALRILNYLEPGTDPWSLLESGEAFSCAISDGLCAVEYPERLSAEVPHLWALITLFEPESHWNAVNS